MSSKASIIAIIGPTGVGKTQLSIRLAKSLKGEVLSLDSCQVYRDNRIMAGTVTEKEMEGINHHLIEYLSPSDEPTDFIDSAIISIKSIHRRGKVPILCGGSISLTEPLLFHPFVERQNLHVICLNSPLETLGTFTDTRIEKMVADGLLDEVRYLYELEASDPEKALALQGIWKTIGYPEFRACCETQNAQEVALRLADGMARMKANTREYFRIQLEKIWLELLPALFQKQISSVVLNVDSKETFAARVELPAIHQCTRWLKDDDTSTSWPSFRYRTAGQNRSRILLQADGKTACM